MVAVDESWWTRVLAGPEGDLHAVDAEEGYVVLPRPSDPRVVVDRASSLAVRDAVERFVASRTDNSAVRRVAGFGSTLLSKSSPRWTVSSNNVEGTLRTHLSEIVGEDVRLAIAVGPPRANRKPVIRCYGERGVVAVAKLGPDPHTSTMVVNEAHWLGVLAQEPLPGVLTPPLLHSGEYAGASLLVMGAMDLRSDLGVPVTDVPLSVVRDLTSRHLDNGAVVTDTPWWGQLNERLVSAQGDALVAEAVRVGQHQMIGELAVSAWHGDWSPWNMGLSPSGALYVWDWERATVGVPTGFDLLHLHYQYGSGLSGADADLDRLGISIKHHNLIKRLYLLEVCAREADAGGLDGARLVRAFDELTQLRQLAGEQ